MRAMVLERFGPPEVMELREVPDPVPEADEVVVKVHAVTVNRTLDVRVRQDGDGRQPILPLVLGVDPAGEVVARGPKVSSVQVGDRVAVLSPIRCGRCAACQSGRAADCAAPVHLGVHRWGGYAEYVAVPAANLVPIPDSLSFAAASVVVRHAPTAHHLLTHKAAIRPGEWVLVMGAAGGLGHMGVQVARNLGARVIAGAGSAERVAAAMAAGAEFGVDYRHQDLVQAVLEITDGRGVDVVFENIGDPELFPKAFATLAHAGRLVTAGAHGGGVVALDVRRLYQRRLRVIGGAGSERSDLEAVLAMAEKGQLRPLIGRMLPLQEAALAHRLVEENRVLGKVVLSPTTGG